MNEERPLFQQSRIPPVLFRPSWRNALGWGSILLDFTLAMTVPGWRLGILILPAWLLLILTRKRESGPAGPPQTPGRPKRREMV
jgi:hypothetical protein